MKKSATFRTRFFASFRTCPRIRTRLCIYALIISALLALLLGVVLWFLGYTNAKSLRLYAPYALYYKLADEKCAFNPIYHPQSQSIPNRNFIAHAGGAIITDNKQALTYTNSKEALLQSIQSGFSFIELDLMLDKDGEIFAAHDYEHFYSIIGKPKSLTPPSKEEITNAKIHGFLTPLTRESIAEIFLQHPNVYLVTDKLNDFDAITHQLPFTDRILIEVFSLQGYYQARKMGLLPMLSTSDIALAKSLKIPMVATHTSTISQNPQLAQEYIAQGGCIMAFSTNQKEFIHTHKDKSATMFYTDYFDINTDKCKLDESSCQTY